MENPLQVENPLFSTLALSDKKCKGSERNSGSSHFTSAYKETWKVPRGNIKRIVFASLNQYFSTFPHIYLQSFQLVKVKVTQLSLTLRPHGLYSPWNSPGQNTGVGSLSLLQGTFPTQGSNPGLPNCRGILYQLSHKGSPRILVWVAYPFSSRSSRPRNQTRVSCIAAITFQLMQMQKFSLYRKAKTLVDQEYQVSGMVQNRYSKMYFYT